MIKNVLTLFFNMIFLSIKGKAKCFVSLLKLTIIQPSLEEKFGLKIVKRISQETHTFPTIKGVENKRN